MWSEAVETLQKILWDVSVWTARDPGIVVFYVLAGLGVWLIGPVSLLPVAYLMHSALGSLACVLVYSPGLWSSIWTVDPRPMRVIGLGAGLVSWILAPAAHRLYEMVRAGCDTNGELILLRLGQFAIYLLGAEAICYYPAWIPDGLLSRFRVGVKLAVGRLGVFIAPLAIFWADHGFALPICGAMWHFARFTVLRPHVRAQKRLEREASDRLLRNIGRRLRMLKAIAGKESKGGPTWY